MADGLQEEYDGGRTATAVAGGATLGALAPYDKRNLRTLENRLLAAITKYTLDSMGDVTEVQDPEGWRTVNR